MLKLKNTPGLTRDDRAMTNPKQKQGGQHRDSYGVLTPLLVSTHLVLAQPQSRFEFPMDEFYRPTLLVDAHHLSRCQLRQIGHQNFGLFRAHVTPFFAQHHGDITDMTQTQALAINPKGFATLALDVCRNPRSLVQLAGQMGDEILDHFLIYCFPGTGNGKDKTPAAFVINLVAIFDHLHVGFGAIGRVATDDYQLCPTRRGELTDHLAKPCIFVLIALMTLGQNEAKANWNAIPVPSDDQQHEADTEKPGVVFAFAAFLSHWVLGPAFVRLAPIANKIDDAVAGWWQGGDEILSHPTDEQMDVPIGGFEESRKAPGGDGDRCPPRHLP